MISGTKWPRYETLKTRYEMTKNGFLNKSESRYEMARLGKKRQNGVQIDKIEKKWVRIDQNGTKWPGYEMTGNWTNIYRLHVHTCIVYMCFQSALNQISVNFEYLCETVPLIASHVFTQYLRNYFPTLVVFILFWSWCYQAHSNVPDKQKIFFQPW